MIFTTYWSDQKLICCFFKMRFDAILCSFLVFKVFNNKQYQSNVNEM